MDDAFLSEAPNYVTWRKVDDLYTTLEQIYARQQGHHTEELMAALEEPYGGLTEKALREALLLRDRLEDPPEGLLRDIEVLQEIQP